MAQRATERAWADELYVSGPDGEEPEWAHTSGWMGASGEAWTISCVVPSDGRQPGLPSLMARLSDMLMEAGQPWEVLVVHPSSDDAEHATMLGWAQLPGFRWLRCPDQVPMHEALWAGLQRARGDAIVVVEPRASLELEVLAAALRSWNGGATLAWTEHIEGNVVLRSSGGEALRGEVELPPNAGGLVLIDRHLLDAMLQARVGAAPAAR